MDRLWTNARIATLTGDGLGLIERGAIVVRDGRIAWVGDAADAPEAADIVDCEGRLITPGLIDCHTHLVYGGSRANEWAMRLEGATYEEIARAGGGIVSTMRATRAMDGGALVESALPRLDALIAEGVTTIEIKSGYGLTLDDEIKMLRASRALGKVRDVRVAATLLAAHAVPPEYKGNADAYVDLICEQIIPASVGLADAVDGFCEGIGFSPEQIARVFVAAKAAGLPVKLHAEQLSHLAGASLAASYRALSADHLEHIDEADIAAMAGAGTVAVLLPGAYYFMRETRKPPVAWLRDAGVPIALATDCNPGTSPTTSLLLMLNMGATLFGLSVGECLRAVTINAARALGLQGEIGTLESGKAADLAIWNITEPAELVYRIGFNPLHARIKDGQCN
ncbi:imidazolonepropionase [Sphingopyxis sp. Root1497]|uniref:imidazolonepropionase n=1 Tax=Sphingopyxis sp. Root1497 TaxID=1736474 RepID=UPI0006F263BA|nr:imidazolonepropionase [Sphingopyxis sp. Root1497]KQZ61674.1 imidazolonepropionase [Sphingopyxis sp. Root1497]